MYRSAVFASSLLSLISPWAGSPGGRYRRSREPRPPAPPPPPRRHSDPDPNSLTNTQQKVLRRFSEVRHNTQEVDLRQELLQLNLNNREVDSWLGSKFDEKEEYEIDFRFKHDIPLQRTISLDRGLDIFNYLQTLSECSDSSEEVYWTIGSEIDSNLRLEQYRSFEDIPVSPKVKSRHISVDVTNLYGNSTALSVLRDSYKGLECDSGSVTKLPQIKKLQKAYSFKNFDEYRESRKSSAEHLERVQTEVDMHRLEVRVPIYRSVSYDGRNKSDDAENRNIRQRRFGVTTNVWQESSNNSLRKEVLIKQNLTHFKSCDDVYKVKEYSRCNSNEGIDTTLKGIKYDTEAINNLRKLKRTYSTIIPKLKERKLPKIVVTEVASSDSIASNETDNVIDSSNLVGVDRNCDCRICSEGEREQSQSFLGRNLQKIFMKIVSYKDYGRNLICWEDDNNNYNESEMFNCFIQLLKMLLGLWLRHFDHKPHNLSVAASV